MANEFKPSAQSIRPSDDIAAKLLYIRKALELIEAHMREKHESPPPWVTDRINQTAVNIGMAVSYVQFFEKQKQAKKASESEPSAPGSSSTAKPKRKKS